VRFEISVFGEDGQPHFLTVVGGLARAEAAFAAVASARSTGCHGIDLTFGEALERWLESVPEGTPERRDREWPVHVDLIPRFGHIQICQIGEWHAIALLDELRSGGYTSWGLRKVLEPMREAMQFAVERGLRDDDSLTTVEGILDEDERPVEIEVEGCRVVDIRRFKAQHASR
jgi:hypothetical protein